MQQVFAQIDRQPQRRRRYIQHLQRRLHDFGADTVAAHRQHLSYIVYVQATLNGAGIAIGWEHLLDDHLADGRLRRASDLRLETNRGYFCCLTEEGLQKPAARQFMEWVCSIARG